MYEKNMSYYNGNIYVLIPQHTGDRIQCTLCNCIFEKSRIEDHNKNISHILNHKKHMIQKYGYLEMIRFDTYHRRTFDYFIDVGPEHKKCFFCGCILFYKSVHPHIRTFMHEANMMRALKLDKLENDSSSTLLHNSAGLVDIC